MTTPATRTSDVRHTPEPWKWEGAIKASTGERVAHYRWLLGPEREQVLCLHDEPVPANADRIVAAVNALAGVPDPKKYVEAANKLRDAIRDAAAALGTVHPECLGYDPMTGHPLRNELISKLAGSVAAFTAAGGRA